MGKVRVPRGFDLKFIKHWYVLANRAEALVYEENFAKGFHYLKRLKNPQGKLKGLELVSDRPGRAFASGGSNTRHAYSPRTEIHEVVAEQFAREIAKMLDKAALEEKFSDLVIMAEPHFLGLLNKEYSKHVTALLRSEMPCEWTYGSDSELESFLHRKLA
jgi:protein required for attachment to host cells